MGFTHLQIERNSWLGGYRPQIPVFSAPCPQLNLLTPPKKKCMGTPLFCWSCTTVYQYNETNVMHFSFNLLRIKGLYMFQALLAHPQEALHIGHLVHCVRIMSVSLQPCHSQLTLYARNIPNALCVAPPEDEQVMLETCRGPWFSVNLMKSASHLFHYTDWLSASGRGLLRGGRLI
jgi:hypothetical protein